MTKKECMQLYFQAYPERLEMAQHYENGLSEQKIADTMKCSTDNVKYVRKELVKLLGINTGGWKQICYELVQMELITEGSRIKYVHSQIPCPYLIETIEALQGRETGRQIKEKDRAWKKKQKKYKG
jgi:hypothetical protein